MRELDECGARRPSPVGPRRRRGSKGMTPRRHRDPVAGRCAARATSDAKRAASLAVGCRIPSMPVLGAADRARRGHAPGQAHASARFLSPNHDFFAAGQSDRQPWRAAVGRAGEADAMDRPPLAAAAGRFFNRVTNHTSAHAARRSSLSTGFPSHPLCALRDRLRVRSVRRLLVCRRALPGADDARPGRGLWRGLSVSCLPPRGGVARRRRKDRRRPRTDRRVGIGADRTSPRRARGGLPFVRCGLAPYCGAMAKPPAKSGDRPRKRKDPARPTRAKAARPPAAATPAALADLLNPAIAKGTAGIGSGTGLSPPPDNSWDRRRDFSAAHVARRSTREGFGEARQRDYAASPITGLDPRLAEELGLVDENRDADPCPDNAARDGAGSPDEGAPPRSSP